MEDNELKYEFYGLQSFVLIPPLLDEGRNVRYWKENYRCPSELRSLCERVRVEVGERMFFER